MVSGFGRDPFSGLGERFAPTGNIPWQRPPIPSPVVPLEQHRQPAIARSQKHQVH